MRALSQIESFYVTANVSIITVCHVKGALTENILQQAVQYAQKRHPLLNCTISQENNQFYFSDKSSITIPIKSFTHVDNEIKRQQIITDQLNTVLPEDKYLFRILMLLDGSENSINVNSKITLVSSIHHAIADGICCIELHKFILQTCVLLMQNLTLPSITPLNIMPPVENFLPTFSENDLADFIKNYSDTAKNTNALAIKPLPSENEKSVINFIQHKLTPAQTSKFIKQCKLNSTTVHAALCAAHLLAIKELLNNPDDEITLCCHSPIDVRSRLQPPISKEQMFSAAIGCGSCHKIHATTTLWELAKEISSAIQQYIESNDIFKGLLTFNETRAKFKLATAIGITNVGVIDLSEIGGILTLDEIYFIPAFTIPMLTASVITFANQLIINYPFVEPQYSAEIMNQIADRALDKIDKM